MLLVDMLRHTFSNHWKKQLSQHAGFYPQTWLGGIWGIFGFWKNYVFGESGKSSPPKSPQIRFGWNSHSGNRQPDMQYHISFIDRSLVQRCSNEWIFFRYSWHIHSIVSDHQWAELGFVTLNKAFLQFGSWRVFRGVAWGGASTSRMAQLLGDLIYLIGRRQQAIDLDWDLIHQWGVEGLVCFFGFFLNQIPHLTKEKKPTVTFSWNVFPHSSSRSMLAIWCRPNQASFDASPWRKCGMQRCARWRLDLKKQLRRREKSVVDSRGSNCLDCCGFWHCSTTPCKGLNVGNRMFDHVCHPKHFSTLCWHMQRPFKSHTQFVDKVAIALLRKTTT